MFIHIYTASVAIVTRYFAYRNIISLLAILLLIGCRSEQPYLVPHSMMVDSLELDRYMAIANTQDHAAAPIQTVLMIYPQTVIDTIYVDSESGAVKGFTFQIRSGMLGLATVEYSEDEVVRLDLFNAFDQRLFLAFAPSYSIYLFHDGTTTYFFDELAQQLYAEYADSLVLLNRGAVRDQ